MKDLIAVVLCLLVSFAVVMAPRGMSPMTPEFWVTPWLYGLPVLFLSWPVYLALFRRLRARNRWILPILGFALSPIPFFLLIFGSDALRGELLASHPRSYYLPWRSVFTIWYAVFGVLLGGWMTFNNKKEVIARQR